MEDSNASFGLSNLAGLAGASQRRRRATEAELERRAARPAQARRCGRPQRWRAVGARCTACRSGGAVRKKSCLSVKEGMVHYKRLNRQKVNGFMTSTRHNLEVLFFVFFCFTPRTRDEPPARAAEWGCRFGRSLASRLRHHRRPRLRRRAVPSRPCSRWRRPLGPSSCRWQPWRRPGPALTSAFSAPEAA